MVIKGKTINIVVIMEIKKLPDHRCITQQDNKQKTTRQQTENNKTTNRKQQDNKQKTTRQQQTENNKTTNKTTKHRHMSIVIIVRALQATAFFANRAVQDSAAMGAV